MAGAIVFRAVLAGIAVFAAAATATLAGDMAGELPSELFPIADEDTSDTDVTLYDKEGKPAAYVAKEEDGLTIYLWEGDPCAFIEKEGVYAFSGKQVGWYQGGRLSDRDGNTVGSTKSSNSANDRPPMKGLKKIKPLRSTPESIGEKPSGSGKWSTTSLTDFLKEAAR